MRSTIKLFKIIALAAIIGLSMTACLETTSKDNAITVTVTGNFSKYNGWEANITFIADINNLVPSALAMSVDVAAATTSLKFEMYDTDVADFKPFEAAGTYTILFWFVKDGETDSDYVIVSRQIKKGSNTIPFKDFMSLGNKWPSQSEWEAHGLSGGLQQPSGTKVISVKTEGLKFTVTLGSVNQDAFNDLDSQMENKTGWTLDDKYNSQYNSYVSYGTVYSEIIWIQYSHVEEDAEDHTISIVLDIAL